MRGRSKIWLGLGMAAAAGLVTAASAQQPRVSGPALSARCDPGRSLGVARVLDVDTSSGPRYGHQQYKEINALDDGEVVLTFDDGPLRVYTQAVVDALDSHCTKATFFMVGSQAIADPEMVRQIQRKGHTIGTHTWSHANLRNKTPMSARQEIELGFSAVSLAAGQPIAPFFRFPFLADTKAMKSLAETRGIGVFSIEVDGYDYKNKDNPQAVHDAIMNQLAYHKKGILLFHDIQPSTAQALPQILRSLKTRGYRVVHLRPTSPATTLPEFDAMARRQADAKRVASASQPLANRAVTWPLPGPGTLAPSAGRTPPPAIVAAPPAPPAYIPPPVIVRPARPRDDGDWRSSVFGR